MRHPGGTSRARGEGTSEQSGTAAIGRLGSFAKGNLRRNRPGGSSSGRKPRLLRRDEPSPVALIHVPSAFQPRRRLSQTEDTPRHGVQGGYDVTLPLPSKAARFYSSDGEREASPFRSECVGNRTRVRWCADAVMSAAERGHDGLPPTNTLCQRLPPRQEMRGRPRCTQTAHRDGCAQANGRQDRYTQTKSTDETGTHGRKTGKTGTQKTKHGQDRYTKDNA